MHFGGYLMKRTTMLVLGGLSCLAARPAIADQVIDCTPGSEDACIALCDAAGGGMQSNPDGSISCIRMLSASVTPERIAELKKKLEGVELRISKVPTK
jgi:hypothetical protein